MSYDHVAIWLDHEEAHIIYFKFATLQNELVRAYSSQPHLHIKADAAPSGSTSYFEKIMQAIGNSIEILLMGPGAEKNELMKYITLRHRYIADRIVGVITADHPSDGELLNFARHYFEKIDQMRMDPIQAFKIGSR